MRESGLMGGLSRCQPFEMVMCISFVMIPPSHLNYEFCIQATKKTAIVPILQECSIVKKAKANDMFACCEGCSQHCLGPSLHSVHSYVRLFSLLTVCTSAICTQPCLSALYGLSKVSNKLLSVFLPSPPPQRCLMIQVSAQKDIFKLIPCASFFCMLSKPHTHQLYCWQALIK